MRRILFLARAEVLHVVRDRATLAQVLVLPIVQLLVLSNAATFEIRNTPVYIVDFDHTSASRGLVNRFAGVGPFPDHRAVRRRSISATKRCCAGDVTMVLTIPHDFEASLVRSGARDGAARRERREGIGGRHRPVVRVADPDAPTRPSSAPSCGPARRTHRRRRPTAPPARGDRASRSPCAAGTTRRSTISTTWCRAFSWRWSR